MALQLGGTDPLHRQSTTHTEPYNLPTITAGEHYEFRYHDGGRYSGGHHGPWNLVVAVGSTHPDNPVVGHVLTSLAASPMDTLQDPVARQASDPGTATESPVSAISWSAILAGAVVAVTVALTLSALGVGLGVAAASPWLHHGLSPSGFTKVTAIWLIVVQWLSAAGGGYLTGRLRTKWVGVHTHEVFFRDTAHGFITWAAAALFGAVMLSSLVSSLLGGGSEATVALSSSDAQPDVAAGAAATVAIYTALSMIVGAFISCVAAAVGGRQRDRHP